MNRVAVVGVVAGAWLLAGLAGLGWLMVNGARSTSQPTDSKTELQTAREQTPTRPGSASIYQGLTAEQWGARLLDFDENTCNQAAEALDHFGSEANPYLRRGLQSNNKHVFYMSALRLGKEDLAPHVKTFEQDLGGSDLSAPFWAAQCLAKAEATSSLPLLKKLADKTRRGYDRDIVDRSVSTLEAIRGNR